MAVGSMPRNLHVASSTTTCFWMSSGSSATATARKASRSASSVLPLPPLIGFAGFGCRRVTRRRSCGARGPGGRRACQDSESALRWCTSGSRARDRRSFGERPVDPAPAREPVRPEGKAVVPVCRSRCAGKVRRVYGSRESTGVCPSLPGPGGRARKGWVYVLSRPRASSPPASEGSTPESDERHLNSAIQ